MIVDLLMKRARAAERAEHWNVARLWWRAWDAKERLRDLKRRLSVRLRGRGHDLVTGALRVFLVNVEYRNGDKPHRCPECHTIECTTPKRFYRLYTCRHCGVRHWPGLRWQSIGAICYLEED